MNNEDINVVWHAKNKYYEADIRVYVSSSLVSDKCRVPPIGAIIYYTDKVSSLPDCNVEKGKVDFIRSLDRWLNSHVQKKSNVLTNSLAENENIGPKEVLDEEGKDSEDVRLIVVENFQSEDIKSATIKWALDKGRFC